MPRSKPPEPTAAPAVRAQLDWLRARAAGSGVDSERVVQALLKAAARLLDQSDPLAQETRRALLATTGLSAPMIEWGLSTTLTTLEPEVLRALVHTPNTELIGVVLAGNVFVAAIRALTLPLLAGAQVLAKAATDDVALAHAWKRALDAADPEVGARLELTQFKRTDSEAARMLCSQVDALSIYGDDDTVHALSAYAAPSCRIIPHGHGVSAAYITREALGSPEAAREAARGVALDIAAYDQRGCLSPQFVLIEPGAAISPREFARVLAQDALPELEQKLPRGSHQNDAAILQWQAVAAVRGELFRAPAHAVSYEAELSLRPSPAGRLVAAYSCNGIQALQAQLEPFKAQLKALGVAACEATRNSVAKGFSTASVCRSGEMQTPAFDAYADGQPPLAGLTRA